MYVYLFFYLCDKQALSAELHTKDKQYTQLIRYICVCE